MMSPCGLRIAVEISRSSSVPVTCEMVGTRKVPGAISVVESTLMKLSCVERNGLVGRAVQLVD
jgi:hypothetical protein